MKCFCRNEPCIHRIKAYEDYQLVCTLDGYFEIVYSPKICVNQRIITVDDEKNMVRVIIKIFNYERNCFENITLVNEIKPTPSSIIVNEIDGLWCFERDKITINYSRICELSVNTIVYLACFDDLKSIESAVYMKNDMDEFAGKKNIKKCITTYKTDA